MNWHLWGHEVRLRLRHWLCAEPWRLQWRRVMVHAPLVYVPIFYGSNDTERSGGPMTRHVQAAPEGVDQSANTFIYAIGRLQLPENCLE